MPGSSQSFDMEELVHKEAIRDLVLRYCRAVDRRDFKILNELYHKDAIDDHGGMFKGKAEEFIAWLPSILQTMKVTSHMVTNHMITIDGNYAEGEVVTIAYHLTQDDQEIIIGGRYLDKYILEDGRWQFQHRKIVMDWNRIDESKCSFDSPVVAGTDVGCEIENDPSAAFFSIFKG